jgi:hypothetical protein
MWLWTLMGFAICLIWADVFNPVYFLPVLLLQTAGNWKLNVMSPRVRGRVTYWERCIKQLSLYTLKNHQHKFGRCVQCIKIVPLFHSSIQLLKLLLSVNKFNQHRYSIHFQSSHTTQLIFNSVYCIHFTRILRHFCHHPHRIHRKKSFSIFPSPAGMSLTKLSLGGNNLYMTPLFEKFFLQCIIMSSSLLHTFCVAVIYTLNVGFTSQGLILHNEWGT